IPDGSPPACRTPVRCLRPAPHPQSGGGGAARGPFGAQRCSVGASRRPLQRRRGSARRAGPCCARARADLLSVPDLGGPRGYVTLYLYLNDRGEGGETCFPLADDRWHRQLPHQQIFDLSMGPEFVSNYSMRRPEGPDTQHLSWNGLGERDGLAAHMAMMPDGAVKYGANLWLNAPWWGATPGRRERRRRRRRSSSPRGGGDL
ncbi:unnamed protein product, partial [Prorocentrum cordatum]